MERGETQCSLNVPPFRCWVAAEIRQKGIRRREFERFITTLENLPEDVTTFEEFMWSSLVEYITVSGKDDLQFTLACGVEMQA